jgi:Protein of unknown function (DUF3124)
MQKTLATITAITVLLMLAISIATSPGQAQPAPPLPAPPQGTGEAPAAKVVGQMIYVPVYSHIYYYNTRRRYLLAVTLSIRNTDLHKPMTITSVRYYDTDGKFLQEYLEKPLQLGPLASTDFFVEERDIRGGAGANFLVEWRAEAPMNAPLVEAVMVGTAGTQGIAFMSPGRVINPNPQ